MQQIIDLAKEHVEALFQHPSWKLFAFHSLEHTMLVYDKAVEWATALGLDDHTSDCLKLAALFHDIGYRTNYDDHEAEGIKMLESFAQQHSIDHRSVELITTLIGYTRKDLKDHSTELAAVIHDIDRISMGMTDFVEIGMKLKQEWQHFKQLQASDQEWYRFQVEYLERSEFKTEYGRMTYDQQRLRNLETLKELARSA